MTPGEHPPAADASALPPDNQWRPMADFVATLDIDGCSPDFWIRKGDHEVIAFFCDRAFDGMPPGWFDRFGDPVGFEPEAFRPVEP